MLKRFLFILLLFPLFFSCSDNSNNVKVITAKGGVRYGGAFRFMSNEKVKNLFPPEVTDIYSNRIASQIFEGLLKINPSGTDVIPSIAKKTIVNDSSTVFTFILRKDVRFQDDPCFKGGKGRKVTAHDFKYSLEFACSSKDMNKISYLIKNKIKGALAYYKGEADHVKGIQVKNDTTLVIKLNNPFSGFNKILTHTGLSVFPKEALQKYGENIGRHPVGTGAFQLASWNEDKIILTRNNHYWKEDQFGNPLPFLDSVVMTYSQNKSDELLSFRKEKIDLVLNIPVEQVKNVLGSLKEAKEGKNVKHKVGAMPSMSVIYYGFNLNSTIFSKKKVRLAFNIAIDRKAIINDKLEGDGFAALHGFVPEMDGYPTREVEGYKYNVEKAQKLMAEAGYPKGKGFPTITLYVNGLQGSRIDKLANAVQASLKKNLGVNIEVKLITMQQRKQFIENGKAIFWRAGWIADYPDPENFLNLFYSGNINENNTFINPFEYESDEFDSTFKAALRETEEEKRMALLAKCDQIIINDAVVMPILTDDYISLVNLKVRGFKTNEMQQLDFSHVYIKELK